MKFDVDEFSKNTAQLPIHHFLRGKLESVEHAEDCKVHLSYQPRDEFANPMGHVQGGMICSMLDDAMGLFATVANKGQPSSTINLNVSFLRPCQIAHVDVEVYFVRQGRRISNIESIASQNGKVVAKATAAFTVN